MIFATQALFGKRENLDEIAKRPTRPYNLDVAGFELHHLDIDTSLCLAPSHKREKMCAKLRFYSNPYVKICLELTAMHDRLAQNPVWLGSRRKLKLRCSDCFNQIAIEGL